MTKGEQTKEEPTGKVLNFDHVVFSVGNAKTTSSYYTTRFGLKPLAQKDPTDDDPVLSIAVKLNKIILVFQSPTTPDSALSKDLVAHGDFVKDVAFVVEDLDQLVSKAKEGGAEVVKGVTEERDQDGFVRYAVLRTYGDNTHTLIDRKGYNGVFLPGYKSTEEDDVLNALLPDTRLEYIDHVEGNLADDTLEDSVSWYEKNLNMRRFWCVDYSRDLVPYSGITSASVINEDDTVLLSMNQAAVGLRPSKVTQFVKTLGTSGVEHIALYTDDIVATIKSLKARGAEVLPFPTPYFGLIRDKLKGSPVKVSESIDSLQEHNILIDFDDRGYMLQAFTKHVQARATVFIEIIQRRNHRGFGAMNYQWVFEAIELLDAEVKK